MNKPAKIGIIGCGKISAAYLKTLTTAGRPVVTVDACADLNPAAAQARAKEFNIPRVLTVEELLADPDIQFVANLTIPEAHAPVSRAALKAGKHVYCEKPLALDLAEARDMCVLARESGLMLSCAPDTLLGSAHQQARYLIDSGHIGAPLSAFGQLFMGSPTPRHYMRPGVGPLLDMGPYYIAALVFFLGPVKRVAALGSYASLRDGNGVVFRPDTPGRVAAVMEFASGVMVHLGIARHGHPYSPSLEIFGGNGHLVCSDPNNFADEILLKGAPPKVAIPVSGFPDKSRGAGLIDMAVALREGRECRLNAGFCLHCLDVLLSLAKAIDSGKATTVETGCERPAPGVPGL